MPTLDGLNSVVHNGLIRLLAAAEHCLDVNRLASVILIYATIDAIAGLEVEGDHGGPEFKKWTARYFLHSLKRRDASLSDLTAEDIWIARCNVIHSFSSLSERTTRDPGVARLYYISRGSDFREEWKPPALTGGRAIPVCVDDLCAALKDAIQEWRGLIAGDPKLLGQVNSKGEQFFSQTQEQDVYFD